MLLCGLLAACATPGALSERATEFNSAIAQAADKQLLQNIVRAAYRNPTRYTAVSKLTESRLTDGTLTVGGQFPFGRDALQLFSLAPTGSIKQNQQPVIDVAPLDDRKFALGLLSPIEPKTFATYWRQDWPRSTLLFLLVDDVRLNESARVLCGLPSRRIDNAAFDPDQFAEMHRFVECIRGRISISERATTATYIRNAAIPPAEVMNKLPDLVKDGFAVQEEVNGPARTYTISRKRTEWTFALRFNGRPGAAMATADARTVPPDRGEPAVVFSLRSVEGIVFYLGELLRVQMEARARGETFEPWVPWGRQQKGRKILFQVNVDAEAGMGPDDIEVHFLNRRFAISREPQPHDATLTALSLLSQLFALHRESQDLPKTTTVQVLGQ